MFLARLIRKMQLFNIYKQKFYSIEAILETKCLQTKKQKTENF